MPSKRALQTEKVNLSRPPLHSQEPRQLALYR